MEKYGFDGEKFLLRIYNDIYLKQSVIHSSGIGDKKYEKIRKYLDRAERVHQKALEHGKLDFLKKAYYDKYVIKEIPKEYIDFLNKNSFEQTGNVLSREELKERKVLIIEDQKKSLSNWIDYLICEDARFYPWWTKYWAFHGMLQIGAYNNKSDIYGKRDEKTVAPFVELNREALAKSIDLVMKQVKGELIEEDLKQLVLSGSFTKLYTVFLKKQREKQYDNKIIEGKWIKYEQGDNYKPLFDALQGYNTGWCTAGEETCKSQLENGDFYVYYTKDEQGEEKIPRLAIRMDGKTRIGEIRGVDQGQNIEPHLEKVLEKKLEVFPDKKNYKKRIADSEMLTYIYTKYEHGKELTKEDLRFIYEIDGKIEGFGYEEDQRLVEIKNSKNKKSDIAKIFDCRVEEVGITKKEFLEREGINIFVGNLGLYNLKSTEGLKLPEIVLGDLDLSGLTSSEGLELPKRIAGSLNLSSLKIAEGLKFPSKVVALDLRSLSSAKGVELPEKIENLYLSSLTSADGLKLPSKIGILDLRSLISAKGLKLPTCVDYLDLSGLTSLEGLELPETVGHLELSEHIKHELKLSRR